MRHARRRRSRELETPQVVEAALGQKHERSEPDQEPENEKRPPDRVGRNSSIEKRSIATGIVLSRGEPGDLVLCSLCGAVGRRVQRPRRRDPAEDGAPGEERALRVARSLPRACDVFETRDRLFARPNPGEPPSESTTKVIGRPRVIAGRNGRLRR